MSSDSKPSDSGLPKDINPDEADFWDNVASEAEDTVLDTSKMKANTTFDDLESLLDDTDSSDAGSDANEIEDLLGSLDDLSKSTVEDIESLPELEELEIDAVNLDSEEPTIESLEETADTSTSFKEKMAMVSVLGILLVVAAVFAYNIKNSYARETSMADDKLVSATGNYATIDGIETWWSDIDGKAKGVRIVPTAKVTLGDASKSGAIRIVFRSFERNSLDQLTPKGDSITKTFTNGKFDDNGESSITVSCSDGMPDEATFLFYRSQDQERWIVEVREAESSSVNAREYKKLAYAPIDPIRK